MRIINLVGFGKPSRFDGAHIIEDREGEAVILVAILEPSGRAGDRLERRPYCREDAWREAVLRRARVVVQGKPPRTTWVEIDPGRDNAETVLL